MTENIVVDACDLSAVALDWAVASKLGDEVEVPDELS